MEIIIISTRKRYKLFKEIGVFNLFVVSLNRFYYFIFGLLQGREEKTMGKMVEEKDPAQSYREKEYRERERFNEISVFFKANELGVYWSWGRDNHSRIIWAYIVFTFCPEISNEKDHNSFEFFLAKEVAEKTTKLWKVEIIADIIHQDQLSLVFKVDVTNAGRGDLSNMIKALKNAKTVAALSLQCLAKDAVRHALDV